ncbi:MAG: tetratricopeptide repeat protein [Bacteroidales bacterium]
MYLLKKYLLFLCVGLVAYSCSTKKNTFVTRTYHNLVSHYNIYFNGNESYKKGIKRIEDSFEEPYNKILPLFYYKDKSLLSAVSSDMDRAIQKSSKLIKNHSLTARPAQKGRPTTPKQKEFYAKKEYNEWVKKAYLLMGNAFFYKEEYTEARKNYQFLIQEYPNHSIRFEAFLGIVRIKIEKKQYSQAHDILKKIQENKDFPEKLLAELYALYTDMHIQKKQYQEAVYTLEQCLMYEKNKKTRVRYTYILAQLYEEIGNSEKAIETYTKVEKMNSTYEMTFQARVHKATAYEGGGRSAQIKSQLKKLRNDEKNKEYKDQIYYALANVYYQEHDEDEALKYYTLSLEHSHSESFQKAMSYLAIGKIFVSKNNYIAAAPYYDSCMMVLPDDYRNYHTVSNMNQSLQALYKEHNEVVTQDSLVRVARMSSSERIAHIDGIIEKVKERERGARQKEAIQREQSRMFAQEFGTQNQKLSGAWYFYNDAIVQLGKTEFATRWGDRKLRDNWRFLSGASQNDWDDNDEYAASGDSVSEKVDDGEYNLKSRDFYLKNIPLTDSSQKVAVQKIEQSLFRKGMIYYNSIHANDLAIKTLESFVERFPESEYTPIAYYYLHRICAEEQLLTKAEQYKQAVITEFPESNYARALTNPSFMKDIREKNKQTHNLYAQMYNAFVQNNLDEVVQLSQTLQESYANSELIPKAVFLELLASGKQNGVEQLQENMKTYMETYPETESYDMAYRIVQYIDTIDQVHDELEAQELLQPEQAEQPEQYQQEEREQFEYKPETEHYMCIIVRSEFVDINRVRFNLLNYNLDYFTNFDFDLTVRELSLRYDMILLQGFTELSQALNYLELIINSDEIFEGVEKSFTHQCLINEQNLNILLKYKEVDEYLSFFHKNYIQ